MLVTYGRSHQKRIYSNARRSGVTKLRTGGRLTPANKRFLLSLGLRLKKQINRRQCYRKS